MRKFIFILRDDTGRTADVRLMTYEQAHAANSIQVEGNPWTWEQMTGASFQRLQTNGVDPIVSMEVVPNKNTKKALTALLEGAMVGFNKVCTPWHYWHAFAPILSAQGCTLSKLEVNDQGHTDRVFVEVIYKSATGSMETIDLCNEFNR